MLLLEVNERTNNRRVVDDGLVASSAFQRASLWSNIFVRLTPMETVDEIRPRHANM
jgi:hypothetical protein